MKEQRKLKWNSQDFQHYARANGEDFSEQKTAMIHNTKGLFVLEVESTQTNLIQRRVLAILKLYLKTTKRQTANSNNYFQWIFKSSFLLRTATSHQLRSLLYLFSVRFIVKKKNHMIEETRTWHWIAAACLILNIWHFGWVRKLRNLKYKLNTTILP